MHACRQSCKYNAQKQAVTHTPEYMHTYRHRGRHTHIHIHPYIYVNHIEAHTNPPTYTYRHAY